MAAATGEPEASGRRLAVNVGYGLRQQFALAAFLSFCIDQLQGIRDACDEANQLRCGTAEGSGCATDIELHSVNSIQSFGQQCGKIEVSFAADNSLFLAAFLPQCRRIDFG